MRLGDGARRGDRRLREGGGELRRGSTGDGGAGRIARRLWLAATESKTRERERRERWGEMVMGSQIDATRATSHGGGDGTRVRGRRELGGFPGGDRRQDDGRQRRDARPRELGMERRQDGGDAGRRGSVSPGEGAAVFVEFGAMRLWRGVRGGATWPWHVVGRTGGWYGATRYGNEGGTVQRLGSAFRRTPCVHALAGSRKGTMSSNGLRWAGLLRGKKRGEVEESWAEREGREGGPI
uniref:Uncharacterized protein n=1 Tax=Oryza sativa subsp. japonica TaxID=39947 RepID=Q6ET08_ORYSJ|nr:hypothetical protein [Oryza sativa Japonica Group]